MKKELVIGLVVLVLFSNLVVAQVNTDDLGNITGDVKSGTDKVLTNEIEIPENLQILTRVAFGLKDSDEVDLQKFIIFVSLWFVLLMLLVNLSKAIFKGRLISWIVGVILTLLVAIGRGFIYIGEFLFSLADLLGFLEGHNLLRLVFILVFLFAVFYILSKFARKLRADSSEEEFREVGQNVGFMAWLGKLYNKE